MEACDFYCIGKMSTMLNTHVWTRQGKKKSRERTEECGKKDDRDAYTTHALKS